MRDTLFVLDDSGDVAAQLQLTQEFGANRAVLLHHRAEQLRLDTQRLRGQPEPAGQVNFLLQPNQHIVV